MWILNLFLPSVKLVGKERVGAWLRRRYDAPRTPLEPLQTCPAADPAGIARWRALRDQLDPFALFHAIDRKIERLVSLATAPRPRPVPPPPGVTAAGERLVRRRRPPPPRHLKMPLNYGNRLRRPLDRRSRVTS